MEERQPFQQMVMEKLDIHRKQNLTDPHTLHNDMLVVVCARKWE